MPKQTLTTKLELFRQECTLKLDSLRKEFDEFRKETEQKFEEKFLTKEEFTLNFDPIKKIVYGLITLILTTVAVAILTQVIK